MRGRQVAVRILDQMQVLNQQVAVAWAVAEQRPDLRERAIIDLAPLRAVTAAPSAFSGVWELRCVRHLRAV